MAIFSYPYLPYVCLLRWDVVHNLVWLLLRFKSSLYILGTSPLSNMYLENTSSQSVVSLFIPVIMSSAEQKFLTLMNVSFFFLDDVFGIISTKSSNPRSLRFHLLSSRECIVLHIILRSIKLDLWFLSSEFYNFSHRLYTYFVRFICNK